MSPAPVMATHERISSSTDTPDCRHELDEHHAEVTEGSTFAGGTWERARYDWSAPGVVSINVIESNAFRAGGHWTYTIQACDEGAAVELDVVRRGRSLKGHLLAGILRVTGRLVFCGDLRKTLRTLETA